MKLDGVMGGVRFAFSITQRNNSFFIPYPNRVVLGAKLGNQKNPIVKKKVLRVSVPNFCVSSKKYREYPLFRTNSVQRK